MVAHVTANRIYRQHVCKVDVHLKLMLEAEDLFFLFLTEEKWHFANFSQRDPHLF